jgi:hypothetical protein
VQQSLRISDRFFFSRAKPCSDGCDVVTAWDRHGHRTFCGGLLPATSMQLLGPGDDAGCRFQSAPVNDRFQFRGQMEWMARRAISGRAETKEASPILLR